MVVSLRNRIGRLEFTQVKKNFSERGLMVINVYLDLWAAKQATTLPLPEKTNFLKKWDENILNKVASELT